MTRIARGRIIYQMLVQCGEYGLFENGKSLCHVYVPENSTPPQWPYYLYGPDEAKGAPYGTKMRSRGLYRCPIVGYGAGAGPSGLRSYSSQSV